MKLASDLREFVGLLSSAGVEFLVVGGHAVAYHGHPRYTGDIDLFVRSTEDNSRKIVAVLEEFGFGMLDLPDDTFTRPETIVQLGYPPNRIDLLTTLTGVEFDAAWAAREPGELGGLSVSFIGRDDLLGNKQATGRSQDLADIEALARVRRK